MWFIFDQVNAVSGDLVQAIAFLPITGLGQFTLPSQVVYMNSLLNMSQVADITASNDGRVWIQSTVNLDDGPFDAGTPIQPQNVLFKSPGPIDQNWAGPWNTLIYNQAGQQYLSAYTKSQPSHGYINCPQSILYDNDRQALYLIGAIESPEFGQDMRLVFIISRDNGQTWSDPIDISNSSEGNRGFQSMALDPITKNLVFGWYDGRDDPTFTSVRYFATVLTAKVLDELVSKIPLSDPVYSLPSVTVPLVTSSSVKDGRKISPSLIKKRFNRLADVIKK